VSRVDNLIENYERFVPLPWPTGLAPAQRVWMAVYNPEEERKLLLHLPAFRTSSTKAGYSWQQIDISCVFENWMAQHEYREAYFEHPDLMKPEFTSFFDTLVAEVRTQIMDLTSPTTIIAITGIASLYGLGESVKVSGLVEAVEGNVEGRLLVFFPGEVDGDNYRLLNAKDGYNYHATLITAEKGHLI